MYIQIAIWGAVVAALLCVSFLLYRLRSREHPSTRQISVVEERSPLEMAGRVPKLLTEQEDDTSQSVREIDCYGHEAQNPERPITDADAVILDLIRQAPELPSAVLELSRILRDPTANIKKIVELVSTDPVLSTKLLRVVNSAAVGRGRITSLQQAVVLLGFNNVWILVNQMLTSSSVKPLAGLDGEVIRSLWRHAAASAVCAKYLLLHAGLITSEIGATVLTCSLVHDVGKFLLRGLKPHRSRNPVSSDPDDSLPPVIMENLNYGIDHCRLGYLLTTYWSLPEEICTVIGYHHHVAFDNWEDIPRHVRTITALVAVSDNLANLLGYNETEGVGLNYRLRPEILRNLGYDGRRPGDYISDLELRRDLRRMDALVSGAEAG